MEKDGGLIIRLNSEILRLIRRSTCDSRSIIKTNDKTNAYVRRRRDVGVTKAEKYELSELILFDLRMS